MSETGKEQRDQVIAQVVSILYQTGAHTWSVQDKGVLMAAIKLQLQERPERGRSK